MNSVTRMNALVYKRKQTLHHHKQIEKKMFINEKWHIKYDLLAGGSMCEQCISSTALQLYIDGRMKQ